jgi:hypothetical protein
MKLYLVPAVAVLMLITSMGIFGFLSKAHSDQSLVGGDVQAKIAVYDEKIKTEKENIETARRALKQMDEGVDQVLGRSTSETGADRAVALRRSQQKERGRLLAEISQSQKVIAQLNESRAPIAAEVRKVEAEVGPLKYIAKLIYGDNPDANLLEKAVTWVIIIIVAVFDPLAIMMLLAATESLKWERRRVFERLGLAPKDEEDKPKSINDFVPQPQTLVVDEEPVKPEPTSAILEDTVIAKPVEEVDITINCDKCGTQLVELPSIGLYCTNTECKTDPIYEPDDGPLTETQIEQIKEVAKEEVPASELVTKTELFPVVEKLADGSTPVNLREKPDVEPWGNDLQKNAMSTWKALNPGHTLKEQLDLLDLGKIDRLPWEHDDHINTLRLSDADRINVRNGLKADNETGKGRVRGFGIEYPAEPIKGDMFLRVDQQPTQLFKYNGSNWIRVNKNLSDSYAYDDAYIDHLIVKISTGEYDTELLSNAERDRIEEKLQQNNS